ncbi:hypothetical protein, partial [Streptomyces scabiei]|uniref:hypothetical protein n=1 Tax=Streptomyces scabiei TaxID=1930 RepID=UPI0029AB47EA
PSAACPYPAAIMPRTRRSPCSPNRDSLCHNALRVEEAAGEFHHPDPRLADQIEDLVNSC